MKTLLITEIFPPKLGGSGRWFWEIYRRMAREGVVIAAGEDPRQGEFDRTHDLRVLRVPLSPPSWGLLTPGLSVSTDGSCRRLRDVVRAEGIEQVHAGRCLPEGLIALSLKHLTRGTPYACYVHGEELSIASQSRELKWLTRRVLAGADLVIANSRNTEGILRKDWSASAGRVRVMHPGVDNDRFVPASSRPDIRARLGWGQRPVILTVGRLQKRKGHDVMIRAIGLIRGTIPDILYVILGVGEEHGPLKDLVAHEALGDHIQFLGAPDDDVLVDCYQQSDLFVLPNREVKGDIEGFGMVLLEAQACGKPVIAGDSGGTAETVRVPETGRVVSCDGPHELARVAIDLLSDRDRLAQMGEAARRWVLERFDWSILSLDAERLFQGVSHAAVEHQVVL